MQEQDLKNMKLETLIKKIKECDDILEQEKSNDPDSAFCKSLAEFRALLLTEYSRKITGGM